MDNSNFYSLLISIVSFIFVIILIKVIFGKQSSAVKAKIEQLKQSYSRETIYLCDSFDILGTTKEGLDKLQFYGEAFGAPIRPGMKICSPSGLPYTIKEVYADDKIPDKQSAEIPVGKEGTAIYFEAKGFDWEGLRTKIKQDKVVPLKIQI